MTPKAQVLDPLAQWVMPMPCALLLSHPSLLDLALPGTAWVTDETEHSLDVEWENPPTQVDYYKLRYGPLTGQEVAEVTVPKSTDPKSRYDITGKNLPEIQTLACCPEKPESS